MGKRRCSHVSHLPVGAELSCPQLEPVPPPPFPPVCLPSYHKGRHMSYLLSIQNHFTSQNEHI